MHRNKPIIPAEEILNEPSAIKKMIGMDVYLKDELVKILTANNKRQLIQMALTSVCTIGVIVVFFFYFTRPTKTDILVFKQIQMERKLLRDSLLRYHDLRDSLRKDRNELFKMQQKK